MEYATVAGVEIATVGMDWPASTGDATITFQNLSDAAEAANNDPHIVVPRVKIGHTSEVNGELAVVNPFAALGDAEPAFGRYVNLRLTNDGATLIGDWVEGPEWLVDAAPSAYPGRSMEARTDVTTEGGKRYSMVIVAVSLLGPIEPAVKDLEDLERFLIEGPSNATTAASRPEEDRMPEVAASVSAGTIRERFNFDWAMSEPIDGIDTYWWWARDVRVDPNEVIADDDEGGCWSIPFETDGKDEVTFGEPVKVREEFVPIAASATTVIANLRDRKGQEVLASNLDRPEKPDKTAASTQPDDEENDEMNIDLEKLRGRLGLPDDATEEQINEALAAEPENPETPEEPETPETPEAEVPEPEPVAASVDPEALEGLKADAAAGREARTTQLKAERDGIVESALKAGKFPPASAASYRAQLEKGGDIEASTRKFIDELEAGVVPVNEIGASHSADGGQLSKALSAFGINRG